MHGVAGHREDACDIVHRHGRDITWRGEQHVHGFERRDRKHARAIVLTAAWKRRPYGPAVQAAWRWAFQAWAAQPVPTAQPLPRCRTVAIGPPPARRAAR